MAPKLPVAKTGPFPRNTQADRAVTVTLAGSGRDAEVKANTDCTDTNTHYKYPALGPPRAVTELHLRTLQPHRSKDSSGCQSQAWIRALRAPVCTAGRTNSLCQAMGICSSRLQVHHPAQLMACTAKVLLFWMFCFYFSVIN